MPDAATHPTAQELAAFSLGMLPERAAVGIAGHLERCPACRQAIEKMAPDSFVGKVRAAKPGTSKLPDWLEFSGHTPSNLPNNPVSPATPLDLPPVLATYSKYHFVRELGRGGMGVVYQAEQTVMGRIVAVKVINPSVLAHPEALPRFQAEVRAAAKLDHPNIVRAFDAEQVGDLHLLVMEFVEGKSLAEVVQQKGPLPIPHACHYIRQAALGLQHAFEQGMVHRDIKPQNLMVNDRGQVKVLDFGLARLRNERKQSRGLTQADAFMGTPEYVSPEQATDARSADTRADIYSLGCTLFYLLTGRPPFQEETSVKVILAQIEKDPPLLHQMRSDVPMELSAVVSRMLAKDPAQRFQQPVEVVQALAAFVKTGAKRQAGVGSPSLAVAAMLAAETVIAAESGRLKEVLRETTGGELANERTAKPVPISPFVNLMDEVASAPKGERTRGVAKPSAAWYWRWPFLAGVGAAVTALVLWMWLFAFVLFKPKVRTGEGGGFVALKVEQSDTVVSERKTQIVDGKAFIVLEVDKPGAEVLVDRQKITVKLPGDNKPTVIPVQPGRHELRVRKDGFDTVVKEIEVKIGESVPIRVNLDKERITNAIGMQFVWIRPGTFLMGSPSMEEGREADETQHQVTIKQGFYLGRHEVTQAQWHTVMGGNPSYIKGDNLPVESVDWDDCQVFCRKLGQMDGYRYRLPTEAEWEYACRAGAKTPFHFGDTITTDQANYYGIVPYGKGKQGIYRRATTPIGSFPPNAWDLFDMHGNVFEWCADRYGAYPEGNVKEDQGGENGSTRIVRGGSWDTGPKGCRAAYRPWYAPGVHFYQIGCRVVLSPSLLPAEPAPTKTKSEEIPFNPSPIAPRPLPQPDSVSSTELLVASCLSNNVLRYDGTTGAFLGIFASGGGLSGPVGITFGPEGNLYVASEANSCVIRYDGRTGAFIDKLIDGIGQPTNLTHALRFGPDGNLYVTGQHNKSIRRYDGKTGKYIDEFVPAGRGGLTIPEDLVFGPDGNLYIASTSNRCVLRFNGKTGAFIDAFVPSGRGGLEMAEGLAFGPDGNLYVSSPGKTNNRVLRYDGKTGEPLPAQGQTGAVFIPDGSGGLTFPIGLVWGPDGYLYVCNRNSRPNNDNPHGSILRYNARTGEFIDVFVPRGSGGLDSPTFCMFVKRVKTKVPK
jgi:formylglycine-generating enzyme required for sulfatase activity/streptogramin lyase